MKKRVIAGVLAAILVFGISGCKAPQGKKETLVVTYVESPVNVPSIVERKEKIFSRAFQDMGIHIEYAEITNGSEQVQALLSGDVDILFAVGAPSVILAASNAADIKVIGAYSRAPKAYQIVTKDPVINCADELKGKTIAGPKGTTLNELLTAYLSQHNISMEEVEYLPMSIGNAWAALEAGEVDAALLAGPTAYAAQEGGASVLTDGSGLIDGTVLVASTGVFCERYPELVKKFQESHREVLDFLVRNHDKAMEITAGGTGLDREAVDAMYPYYDFHADLTQEDIRSINKTMTFMTESGMIDGKLDAEDIIFDGNR